MTTLCARLHRALPPPAQAPAVDLQLWQKQALAKQAAPRALQHLAEVGVALLFVVACGPDLVGF